MYSSVGLRVRGYHSNYTNTQHSVIQSLIQYMEVIWPSHSLRDLSLGGPDMISVSFGFPDMLMLQTLKRKHYCSDPAYI